MNTEFTSSIELNDDQQAMLRGLLDSEVILIGGGDIVGVLN